MFVGIFWLINIIIIRIQNIIKNDFIIFWQGYVPLLVHQITHVAPLIGVTPLTNYSPHRLYKENNLNFELFLDWEIPSLWQLFWAQTFYKVFFSRVSDSKNVKRSPYVKRQTCKISSQINFCREIIWCNISYMCWISATNSFANWCENPHLWL